ncbi:MAG TPA: ABC transporter ATP-binding protein [Ktedonobacterales bacterium]|nr:ABC transporter ATP-binding protein [Ktedonobacterales bacterium]
MRTVTGQQAQNQVDIEAIERSTAPLDTTEQASPAGQDRAAAIEISNLVVNYGAHRAVDGLTMTVPQGSIFGFLGPNGAGKTTTIKALLGLRPLDGGSVRVLGYDAAKASLEVRARVGYVPEVNSLYDYLTIPQICAFCRATSRQWNQQVVDRYIGVFGLPAEAKVGRLSKGMKSQLALSLALGSSPDLLILDEPTAGLDPVARHEFLNKLVAEIAAEGKTIFFSSHILSEVEAVADWVGIIRRGKLVVSDELDHLKQTQKVLKLTYAELPPPAALQELRSLPTVMSLAQEGRSVRLLTHGDVQALTQTIQARPYALRDVDTVDLNLEDLFLEYMKENSDGR